MTKLAIQESLLPGAGAHERLAAAAELGFSGVEFAAAGLDERLDEIYDSLNAHGLAASGVNMGAASGWLAADRATRADAADSLRRALTCALDLEAEYVSFVPQIGESDLPDLTPFASPLELQKELFIWLLRGISDLADAMETKLAMLPLNRGENRFVTCLDDAAFFRRQVDDHPNITLAANTRCLALEEDDMAAALAAHCKALSAVYLVDDNGRLPGRGSLQFASLAGALRSADFTGWLVLAGECDGAADLSNCLDCLRHCQIT
ncbi:MAG: sugar phosphate isomerase/epimerase [Chloroflexi bacterium]|nr:sugar phosphate isomerase/epimerase [Chloroflexota bacterium]